MRAEIHEELEKYTFSLPILDELSEYLKHEGKLEGQIIGWHCHLTEITAATASVIVKAGATLLLSECNPDTTSKQAVEYMRDLHAKVYLGPDSCAHVLEGKPRIISDTGLVLTRTYLAQNPTERFVYAASEITTSGISCLREMDETPLPVVNINDGFLKSYIENFHGVGDGVVDALFRVTSRIWAGRRVAVIGYGRVGAGVANYLKRGGSEVTVVEHDPIKRLLAHYDGYSVCDLQKAVNQAELIVTATGRPKILGRDEWAQAADGLLVMNVGHWATEVDVDSLHAMANGVRNVTEHLQEFRLPGGKRIYLLAAGSPANVVLLSGSPEPTLIHLTTEVLCMNYLTELQEKGKTLPNGEIPLPDELERRASLLALQALKLA